MSFMMMLALGGRKAYVPTVYTKTFNANATFPMPAGVSVLDSVVGHGASGQPATSGESIYFTQIVTTLFKRTGGSDTVTENVDGWSIGTGNGSDYCEDMHYEADPAQGGSAIYYATLKCYYYKIGNSGGSAATTGASATGFGKVFPGGTGGPASDVTFTNVPVTAGANYPVVVPSGGSITITYKV